MSRHRTLFVTERGLRHQKNALEAAPPELALMLRQPDRAQLWPYLAEVEFLISERTGIVDADMISAAPHLKLILRLGSLAHDIDLEAARAARVIVCMRPQAGVTMVAEHLVMQMLALVKRLREVETIALGEASHPAGGVGQSSRRTDEDTFAYNWSGRTDIGGLWRKDVGILGFGEIGAELARRLRGWGCRVRYYRRRPLPAAVEAELQIGYADRPALLAESDFLVVLLPYSAQTDQSLDAAAFARMKRGAFVVSCGSGSVIVEAHLAEALRAGHLAGAALDTYEWEPLRDDNPLRLLALESPTANILLTPHTAAGAPPPGTVATRADDYTPIVQFLRGEPVENRLA